MMLTVIKRRFEMGLILILLPSLNGCFCCDCFYFPTASSPRAASIYLYTLPLPLEVALEIPVQAKIYIGYPYKQIYI